MLHLPHGCRGQRKVTNYVCGTAVLARHVTTKENYLMYFTLTAHSSAINQSEISHKLIALYGGYFRSFLDWLMCICCIISPQRLVVLMCAQNMPSHTCTHPTFLVHTNFH